MKRTTLVAIATFTLVAACASAPKRVAQLDEARVKVEALSQDPLAQQAASRELAAARANLDQAETALKKGEPEAQVAHFAYLAGRNAEIGEARIDEVKSRDTVKKGEAERNRVLLEARTQEVDVAKHQAAAAQATAEVQAGEAEAARRELAELQAKKTERGMVMTLGDVLFDTNAATLKPGAELTIDRLSKFLDQNADTRLIIEGHTDSQGSDAYNEELSRRRAQAVADDLVSRGVASSRLEVLGRGEGYPVADNSTSAGRQQNRRVEIVFSDEGGKFQQGASAETPE
jgi:outer membrane protein OmpA-like peptidoglycan-associated protein